MQDQLYQLQEQARNILSGNWTGKFTMPAANLYPHQWSWDSAFIAMGYAHYHQERAQQELRSLFAAQWRNGMVPHIVFNPESDRPYFPGPDIWQIHRSPGAPAGVVSSGIAQPPVHASAVLHIYRHARDREQAYAFLQEMFPRLLAWHTYLYNERDPFDEGLVYIRHPWESGQDNSPIWDAALANIHPDIRQLPPIRRVDLNAVSASERPADHDYQRYIYLVQLFATHRYQEEEIFQASPFLIQDVLFNTLLCQANFDLAEIAQILGHSPEPFRKWGVKTRDAINQKLWNEKDKFYYDYDLRAQSQIPAKVCAGFSPLLAKIPNRQQATQLYHHLANTCFCRLDESCYAVPSYDKCSPDYSPTRYWRGPVWINMNWLICQGLMNYGYQQYARRVFRTIVELPRLQGFYEYYDSDTGKGYGAKDFSWTAALLLDALNRKSLQKWIN